MPTLNFLFRHHKLGIKRSDLVIEIGSGGDPLLRSDILVEKYIEDDTERYSGLVLDRPTIAADGTMLPFLDKSIDYIICSHVLEHIVNPKPFLDELCRVGKRGLIITPYSGYEKLHPKGGHLWYVWNQDVVLHFKQKKCWNEFPEVREYFRKVARLPGYWHFWNKHYSFFNTIFEWKNNIDYRIEQDEEFDLSKFKKATDSPNDDSDVVKTILMRQHIKSLVAKMFRPLISAHWSIDINNFICCPLCKGKLKPILRENTTTKCSQCGSNFPIKRSIARLLREEAFFES